jgi:hypothetical protein
LISDPEIPTMQARETSELVDLFRQILSARLSTPSGSGAAVAQNALLRVIERELSGRGAKADVDAIRKHIAQKQEGVASSVPRSHPDPKGLDISLYLEDPPALVIHIEIDNMADFRAHRDEW